MNIESKQSGHWTDDQLIAHLYGVGPADGHLGGCAECQTRAGHMQATRSEIEQGSSSTEAVGSDFLAAQRRQIYAKLTATSHWWNSLPVRRWASAAAACAVLGGSLFYFEQSQQVHVSGSQLSDVQLAQDVNNLSDSSEASPTAPLQALFE